MKKAICFFLFLLSNAIYGQDNNIDSLSTGLIYGKEHAFLLSAPNGWVLDNSSGLSQGIQAVFYPKGGSWNNSNTVMYANTASKSSEGNETIEKLIEYDLENFKKRGALVVKDTTITLERSDNKAILKYFDDSNYGNYEIVAYIDEEKIVALIVLSSRDKAEFSEAIPKFIELLNSYVFVTKDVIVE